MEHQVIVMVSAMAIAFTFGWIFSRFYTENRMRREQIRRELELQKIATFKDFIDNLQGGTNG